MVLLQCDRDLFHLSEGIQINQKMIFYWNIIIRVYYDSDPFLSV